MSKELVVQSNGGVPSLSNEVGLTMEDILAYRVAKFEQTLIAEEKDIKIKIQSVKKSHSDTSNKYNSLKTKFIDDNVKKLTKELDDKLKSIGIKISPGKIHSIGGISEITHNKEISYNKEISLWVALTNSNNSTRSFTLNTISIKLPKEIVSLSDKLKKLDKKVKTLNTKLYEIRKKLMSIDVEERRARGTVVAMKLSKSKDGQEILKQLDNL